MICRTLMVFLALECVVSAATFVSSIAFDRTVARHVAGYEQFDGISLSWTAGESDDYPSSRHAWRGSLSFANSVDLSLASMNLRPGDQVDNRLFSEVLDAAPELSVAVRKSYRLGKVPRELFRIDGVPTDPGSYTEGYILDNVQVNWSTPFEGLDSDWVSVPEDLYSPYQSDYFSTTVDTRYVGFRHVADGQTHFGWLEVLASERGFRLGTLYLSDRPEEAVRVSMVPEPNSASFWLWGLVALVLVRGRFVSLGA